MEYNEFIEKKFQKYPDSGFDPLWIPDFLFDFQAHIDEWAIRKGRSAILADCGTGKTPMALVWCQNVIMKTNRPVLYLTPLAVAGQTKKEADKFCIDAFVSRDGSFSGKKIIVTNYEKLHFFNHDDFGGVYCDEASILKNFQGKRKAQITDFMKKIPYRLLGTATASPNDYPEIGTCSEALGYMGYIDMISEYFTTNEKSLNPIWKGCKMRFKPHAEPFFWKFIASWAKAMQKPSDLGFDDNGFILPELIINEHVINCSRPMPGKLFVEKAITLAEQRHELKATINERCEKAAELAHHNNAVVIWGHNNDECDLMEKMIPGSVQISGRDKSDDEREDKLNGFSNGEIRALITKPKIGCFGLNWQHCNHTIYFPSHSFEQYYQSLRRFWRFGQKEKVYVDIVTTEGGEEVLANLNRKAEAAQKMFRELIGVMNDGASRKNDTRIFGNVEVPSWI